MSAVPNCIDCEAQPLIETDGNSVVTNITYPCGHEQAPIQSLDEQHERRLAVGLALRGERVNRDLSLRQRAAELGIDFVDLSKLENGKL